ncbi:kinase-like domain-containing protein [Cantharellus anzutake]|uniref:kinase-like domain-containing protein n=1 Tax=Cantharellus anzutake TaxID=1750568 RepID=UPI001908A715|nr:kinase-like domain-containing protein [Cantharellus anzutake]KAF8341251.1 kinase-like domain-containing protein [Cantharellus anzutake]
MGPESSSTTEELMTNENPYVDTATNVFLDGFRNGLSGVLDVSGKFDHRTKVLKASGGYSHVYVAYCEVVPGTPRIQVCYKELRPGASNAPEQIWGTRKMVKHLTQEVKIWKDLKHPNIIEFIGYAIEGERSEERAILISKWCKNGDVVEYLRTHPDSSRIQLLRDMANGLHYLHSQEPAIVHGDLKPQNVLINDQGMAQLCDFGLSRAMNEVSRIIKTSTVFGCTIRYSAPEVIIEEIKTMKSDIYAFGCTSIQIWFGQHPFPRITNDQRLFDAIGKYQAPWMWDSKMPLERILSLCCQAHQEDRPSIRDILQQLDNPLIYDLRRVQLA